MTNILPKINRLLMYLLALSVVEGLFIYCSLFFTSSIFAQEIIAPTVIEEQVVLQENIFEEFINNLLNKDVPKKLDSINDANLPYVIGEEIEQNKNESDPTAQINSEDGNTQETIDPNTSAAKDSAFGYAVGTAAMTNEDVSTDPKSFFGSLIGFIKDILGIGNEKADNFTQSYLPQKAVNSSLSKKDKSISQLELAFSHQDVLGEEEVKDNMSNALNILNCAELPSVLCSDTKGKDPSEGVYPEPTGSLPTPGTGEGNELFYDIIYYKNTPEDATYIENIVIPNLNANMDILSDALKRRWGNSKYPDEPLIYRWTYVRDLALSKNWNPAFVLSIWIEETAASSVCSIADRRYSDIGKIWAFGIYDFGVLSKPKTYCQDSPSQKHANFERQLDIFLGLYKFYQKLLKKGSSPLEFEEFLCVYSEGHYPCEFDINPGFLKRLPQVYDCLVSDQPSAASCPAGYFKF